jgi:hypothetical protein
MKKILAAVSVAALVAGAASAVDVSSMIHIDGNALDVTTAGDGSVKFLELNEYDPSGDSDYLWKLSASGDNFGAEIWSWSFEDVLTSVTTLDNPATTDTDEFVGTKTKMYGSVSSKKIWFSPLDFLKVTVGNVGGQSIANPQFGWWAQSTNNYNYGYQAELTFGSLAAKIALEPGAGNYWIDPSQANAFNGKIGKTWADVTYDLGDFGKVQGIVNIGGSVGAHGVNGWKSADLAFGVAYNKMPFGATGFYGDAVVSFVNGTDGLTFGGVDSQIGGQVVLGAITVRETNVIAYWDEFKFGFEARAEYAAGSFTPYVNVDGYKIMAAKPAMEFQVGCGTSVGSVSIDAHLSVPVEFVDSYAFNFSIPVSFELKM